MLKVSWDTEANPAHGPLSPPALNDEVPFLECVTYKERHFHTFSDLFLTSGYLCAACGPWAVGMGLVTHWCLSLVLALVPRRPRPDGASFVPLAQFRRALTLKGLPTGAPGPCDAICRTVDGSRDQESSCPGNPQVLAGFGDPGVVRNTPLCSDW